MWQVLPLQEVNMRTCRVIGTVTLSRRSAELPPAQLVIAQPQGLETLSEGRQPTAEPLVALDQLGAAVGEEIAVSEGREAAMPFHPQPVPIDAYCAAILDRVTVIGATAGEMPSVGRRK